MWLVSPASSPPSAAVPRSHDQYDRPRPIPWGHQEGCHRVRLWHGVSVVVEISYPVLNRIVTKPAGHQRSAEGSTNMAADALPRLL
jgi:hypothetical protein